MYQVDINSDLGESFGNFVIGADKEIIPLVSSVNIACGWHGGDAVVMENTILAAKKYGVSAGAHPGYPDLLGFGRRNISVTQDELRAYVKYQIGALAAFAKSANVPLVHVKPHGAMYNMAAVDAKLAQAIAQAIYEVDKELILLALANSKMIDAAKEIGLRYASEVFADRGYMPDGTLVPRAMAGAFIHDPQEAITRVVRMIKEKKVASVTGEDIAIQADSICVHGDNKSALEFVCAIRKALEREKISVVKLGDLV